MKTPATKLQQERRVAMTPSPQPGPSRHVYHQQWNRKSDDDRIPSDESDAGDIRCGSPKRRVRKRNRVPVPRGLNLGAVKLSKVVISNPVSAVEQLNRNGIEANEQISSKGGGSGSTVEGQNDNLEGRRDGNSEIDRSFTPSHVVHQRRKLNDAEFSPCSGEKRRRVGEQEQEEQVDCRPFVSRDLPYDKKIRWVLFSMWNPAWSFILKCEDNRTSMGPEEFRELVVNAIDYAVPFPSFYKGQINFKLLQVSSVEKGGDANRFIGKWCRFMNSVNGSVKKGSINTTLSPTEPAIGKVLSFLVSPSDLLLLFTPAKNLRFPGNEEYAQDCSCLVHLTSKDYNKTSPQEPSFLDLLVFAPDVDRVSCRKTHEEYGSYTVVKYSSSLYQSSSNIPCLSLNRQQVSLPVPVENPACGHEKICDNVALLNSPHLSKVDKVFEAHQKKHNVSVADRDEDIAFGADREKNNVSETNLEKNKICEAQRNEDDVLSNKEKEIPCGSHQERDNACEAYLLDVDIALSNQEKENACGAHRRDEDIALLNQEKENACGSHQEKDKEVSRSLLEANLGPQHNVVNLPNFSYEYWMNEGIFVPGPLRPKLKKPDQRNTYVYHKLSELDSLLLKSVEEDRKYNRMPNMMVKQQCNAYGVVVAVLDEHRHANCYYVRISDETMESVLLRIHPTSGDNTVGPQIEVGHIIRIHRLTVQMEWDSWISDNAMVLSTSSHRNYVLFTQSSKTYQFYFDTCAKSITLNAAFDKKRIGELQVLKRKLIDENNEVSHEQVPESENPEVQNSGSQSELVSQCQQTRRKENLHSTRSSPSDGIYASDVLSASPSENGDSLVQGQGCNASGNSSNNFLKDSMWGDKNSEVDGDQRSPNIQPQPKKLPDESQTSQLNVTLFKDLRKTDSNLNLLFQIVRVGAVSGKNIWRLFIKDLECTTPSTEFFQPTSGTDNLSNLVLNITNAKRLVDRGIFMELYNNQGTDELFFVDKVKITGAKPPYQLEVDGDTCNIRRYTNLMEYLNLNETFSIRLVQSQLDNNSSPMEIVTEDSTDATEGNKTKTDSNAQPSKNVPVVSEYSSSGSSSCSPAPNEMEIENRDSETSESVYLSATTSPVKPTINMNANAINSISNKGLKEWTGKLSGRRKPRKYYEPESDDS